MKLRFHVRICILFAATFAFSLSKEAFTSSYILIEKAIVVGPIVKVGCKESEVNTHWILNSKKDEVCAAIEMEKIISCQPEEAKQLIPQRIYVSINKERAKVKSRLKIELQTHLIYKKDPNGFKGMSIDESKIQSRVIYTN